MQRRLALVVGGTGNSIGSGIALALAKQGIDVTVVGRSVERGNETLATLQAEALNQDQIFEFVSVDLFVLANVHKFCQDFRAKNQKLDILVLSQGRAIMSQKDNGEGLDIKLVINYFSRISIAIELAPLLDSSPSPRVLTVLSGGVHAAYKHYETDFELKSNFSLKNAADAAGLYNDTGFDSLSKEHPNWVVCHSAPGVVRTNWGLELNCCFRCMMGCMTCCGKCFKSPTKAGELLSTPLLDEKWKKGFYTLGQTSNHVSKTPVHEVARPVIWKLTLESLAKRGILPDAKISEMKS